MRTKRTNPFPGTPEKQLVKRPFITKTGRKGCQNIYVYVLTAEQEAWLRRWYPEVENSVLMQMSGLKHATLHRYARQLGLKKSEEGMHGIMRRQAAHVRRLCERNGYYDSIRGRRPSEASMAGTARMWAEIRDGKREHPFAIMKREHPRRYTNLMKRKSVELRETIRKENFRLKYGLTRQTCLSMIVLYPYTARQRCHRNNARLRGYIPGDKSEQSGERYIIYYDQHTNRAPIFERNLMRDGFKVVELT